MKTRPLTTEQQNNIRAKLSEMVKVLEYIEYLKKSN